MKEYFKRLELDKSIYKFKTRNDRLYENIDDVDYVKTMRDNCFSSLENHKSKIFEINDTEHLKELIAEYEMGISKIINLNKTRLKVTEKFKITKDEMDSLLNDLKNLHEELNNINSHILMRD